MCAMTTILIEANVLGPMGSVPPGVSVSVSAVPFSGSRRPFRNGDAITFPADVSVSAVSSFDLPPSGDFWCWRVEVRYLSWKLTRYVRVPDGEPVKWWSLIDVDPETLEPSGDNVSAWEAARSSMVTGSRVVGNDLVMVRRDGNEFTAGNVRGPKGDRGVGSEG